MKAVILAAGMGKRLGAITKDIPKPMIEIAGRPILEHNILMCKNSSVEEVFINLHHLPHVIKQYFGNGARWRIRINYRYEPELLGTAGAVKNFSDELLNEPFFVIYGDNYFDFDLHVLMEFHREKKSDFTIALIQIDDVSHSGIAEITKNGKINGFIEKPINNETNSRWVNAGIYLVEPIILNEIKTGYIDFGYDVIPLLIKRGFNVYGYKMKKKVLGIDTLKMLEKHLRVNQERSEENEIK